MNAATAVDIANSQHDIIKIDFDKYYVPDNPLSKVQWVLQNATQLQKAGAVIKQGNEILKEFDAWKNSGCNKLVLHDPHWCNDIEDILDEHLPKLTTEQRENVLDEFDYDKISDLWYWWTTDMWDMIEEDLTHSENWTEPMRSCVEEFDYDKLVRDGNAYSVYLRYDGLDSDIVEELEHILDKDYLDIDTEYATYLIEQLNNGMDAVEKVLEWIKKTYEGADFNEAVKWAIEQYIEELKE